MVAAVLACACAPAVASAEEDWLRPYKAVVDDGDAVELAKAGVDLEHAGYDTSKDYGQAIGVVLTESDANRLEARGLELEELSMAEAGATAGSLAADESPNPFYSVYRTFMEPGGIHDEMLELAAENRDIVKYERIGTSTLGKPMAVLKVTQNARNVADGTRPAVLYSSNNHAREWIAAEVERRLMRWIIEHKNDAKIADLLVPHRAVVHADPEPGRLRLHVHLRRRPGQPPVRPDRDADQPLLAQDAARQRRRRHLRRAVAGGVGDGVDPNRNYPAKRAIDEEGAVNQTGGETYRGPYALSEPENLAFDRLLRKIDFQANVNYHSAGQLLLTPVSYITDYAPVDATIFNAMTGTDGDGAVEPYTPQRSSDLYESNGDTIDNGYMNYGVIGWTPELDTCATGGGPAGCNQFAFPDDEEKVRRSSTRTCRWRSTSRTRPASSTARRTSTTIRRSTRSRPPTTSSRPGSTCRTGPPSRSRRTCAARSARST